VPQNETRLSLGTNACFGGGGTGAINWTGLYGHPLSHDASSWQRTMADKSAAVFFIKAPFVVLFIMRKDGISKTIKINDSRLLYIALICHCLPAMYLMCIIFRRKFTSFFHE
jgi:hypothetical protein